MSVEEEQRKEIARLTTQVEQLQQQLRNATAEADRLRSAAATAPDNEHTATTKAIWAAVRRVVGEDGARRIEEEVSKRPIVAAPKVRRRGTMPHMPAPHLTVVAKTAAAPKWPPAAHAEVDAPEVPVKVVATPVEPDHSEGPKPEFDVESDSVPPSVARRLFDLGFKGKDQNDSGSTTGESLSLKLEGSSEPESARVVDVPSPMRRRESPTSVPSIPPLPRQKVTTRSATPTGALLTRRVPAETPPPPQVLSHDPITASSTCTTPSVRDRVRQLELSARRNSIQS